MNEYHIGEQSAHSIYQADQIFIGSQPRDHAQIGERALAQHDYASARIHLGRAIDDNPADPKARYRLALALLGGQRPHMNTAETVEAVTAHLSQARQLREAQVLQVLVNEDYYLAWQRSNAVPPELVNLVASVSPASAKEITEHVPAEQCRVWRLLKVRTGEGF